MKNRTRIAAIVLAAGIAAPAIAQDSVTTTPFVSDVVSDYTLTEQVNTYVLDLDEFTSSWGQSYGIGTLMKAPKDGLGTFQSDLLGAHNLSSDVRTGVPLPYQTYSVWNSAGPGINGAINTAPTDIQPGLTNTCQMSYGVTTFSGAKNGILGGYINYDPADPSRLYVSRVVTALNSTFQGEDTASFGLGRTDADGNLIFRADPFGADSTAGNETVVGNNILRVNLGARSNGVLNDIREPGGAIDGLDGITFGDTGDLINNADGVTNTIPTVIPASATGTVSKSWNLRFGTAVYENPVNTITDSLGANEDPGISNTRGAINGVVDTLFPNTVATMGCLANVNGSQRTAVNLWGVDATGAVTATSSHSFPQSITDANGFNINTIAGFHEFQGVYGSVNFNGTAQVAMCEAIDGNFLVAGNATFNASNNGSGDSSGTDFRGQPERFIPVCVITPTGSSWILAAWCAGGTGSPIYDGDPLNGGVQIGTLDNFTDGDDTMSGPGASISGCAFDSAGNIYFTSAINTVAQGETFGVLRAVYNPNAGSPRYDLELLAVIDDTTFTGQNSTRDFQISFIDINGGGDSTLASQSTWGDATNSSPMCGFNPQSTGVAPQTNAAADPRNLGGFVLNCSIVYDTAGGGAGLNEPNGTFDFAEGDESISAVLFINGAFNGGGEPPRGGCELCVPGEADDCSVTTEADCNAAGGTYLGDGTDCSGATFFCPCDWNCDGNLNDQDFFDWVNDFFNAPEFDFNNDGFSNDQDWFDFTNCFFNPGGAGC